MCSDSHSHSGLFLLFTIRGSDGSIERRCLFENETACPLCTRQHGVIQEIRRNNERLADQHDLFPSEVKESGFRAVAGGFGRGWLGIGGNVAISG